MEELKMNYYFGNIHEFPVKDILNYEYPWEALNNLKDYMDENITDKKVLGKLGDFVSITGNCFIDEGTNISANVTIEGPVYIGKNCTIQSGALIRPYSFIGDGCTVGHSCEVKHSIVQNKAKVQSFTFIGNSIIGKSTRVGSGTILANRRFDQKNITIKKDGLVVDTGTDFFGAIVGDSSRLGANSTTVPGTFIGKYTWVLPTVQVRGFVPSEKRIMNKQELVTLDNPKVELK